MEQCKMTGDKLLVKREDFVSEAGIILLDTARKSSMTGTVVACGEKCTEVSPGDTVFYKGTGYDVSDMYGENHIILREGLDVLMYQKPLPNGI